jgi:hypothetical protein
MIYLDEQTSKIKNLVMFFVTVDFNGFAIQVFAVKWFENNFKKRLLNPKFRDSN